MATWNVKLGMPEYAQRLQEVLCSSSPVPSSLPTQGTTARRSSKGGDRPVPSWHQSQQLLRLSRALFSSSPHFHVFLLCSFCRRAFPCQDPAPCTATGSSHAGFAASAPPQCFGEGNRVVTGDRAPDPCPRTSIHLPQPLQMHPNLPQGSYPQGGTPEQRLPWQQVTRPDATARR